VLWLATLLLGFLLTHDASAHSASGHLAAGAVSFSTDARDGHGDRAAEQHHDDGRGDRGGDEQHADQPVAELVR
jgi:hypothetical protein